MAEGAIRDLMLAALVGLHLGLALVLGAAASMRWLARSAASAWRQSTTRQATVLHGVGFVLGLVALLVIVVVQAASMTDDGQVPSLAQLWLLIARTHYGHAWLIGLVAWVLAGGLLHRATAWPRLALGGGALAVFVLTRSVVSHAGAQGDFTVDVAMDWVHLTLVGLWVGIVVVGALQQLPEARAGLADRAGATRWVGLMSDTATGVIAGIGLTGLCKVWQGLAAVGAVQAYLMSDYGGALIVKLALVGVAGVLGGLNKFVVLPRLAPALTAGSGDASRWRRSLLLALRLEWLVLVGALIAAAVLSSTEWPGDT